ncbi:MAG: hypothetical protein ACRDZ8_15525 [Acidimicrobiales bacterium]
MPPPDELGDGDTMALPVRQRARRTGGRRRLGASVDPRFHRGGSAGEGNGRGVLQTRWRPDVDRWVVAAHVATLMGGLIALAAVDRNQWFFGDDWEFLVDRGLSHAMLGLWTPHNEHWTTLPILLYRALFTVFGVRTYWPYVGVLILIHLLVTTLLWRVMLRCGVAPWVATALAGIFAVLGAGSENLVWAFQICFVGSVFFGLIALGFSYRGREGMSKWDVLAWLALVAALMCSLIGVAMVAVAGFAVMLGDPRRWRQALRIVSVPAAVFAVWFALAGRSGLHGDHQSLSTVLAIPKFAWTALVSAFERTSGIPGSGTVLLVALIGWVIARSPLARERAAPAFAMALGTLILFVVIGLGRAGGSLNGALAPRYAYLAVALLLPVIGLALTDLIGHQRSALVPLLLVLSLVAVTNVDTLRADSDARIALDQPLERQIVAAAALVAGGAPLVRSYPEPVHDPNLTAAALATMARQGKLPSPVLGPADRIAAAAALQVGLLPAAAGPSGPMPTVTGAQVTDEGDCLRLVPAQDRAVFSVTVPAGGAAVQLTSATPAAIGVQLVAGGVAGPVETFHLPANRPEYLSVTAAGDTVTVRLPPTPLRYCR